MKKIFVVTEGQSETNFVNRILCEYFMEKGILLIPNTIITGSDLRHGKVNKGGIETYGKAWTTIKNCLSTAAGKKSTYVTTMIDYYGLPKDFPGLSDINGINNPYDKVAIIEERMKEMAPEYTDIYFPYIQLHEFETLEFADLSGLKKIYFDQDISELEKCAEKYKNPELINNLPETSPSKRILNCIKNYDKCGMGIDALKLVGLKKLYDSCKHFREWIIMMENI